ncbi:MAG: ABC transporter ATP-binding protein [Pirellulales bacterium]
MRELPILWRYLKPYRRLVFASATLMVVAVVAGLATPWPLMVLVDHVLGNEPLPAPLNTLVGWLALDRFQLLVACVVIGVAITLLEHGLSVLNSYVDGTLEQSMILDLRSDLFAHAQRLSLAYHDQRQSGMLIYAINWQADSAAGLVMAVPPLLQSLLTLIGMFWISLHIDATLALISLAVMPFLYYSVGYYVKHIQKRLEKVRTLEGQSLSIVHEAMSMLRVIVAFGREPHEHARFRRQAKEAVNSRIKVTVSQTLFSMAVNTITAIGTALVLGVGAYHVLQGQLTVGKLLVFMSYLASVYKPLEAISNTIGSLQERIVSLRMACQLLELEPEIKDAPGAINLSRPAGQITFDNVSFNYAGRTDTLNNLSFEARPGEVIAVVGPTGAGKTTLVSLIPRFYAPQHGRILFDGVDVRQIRLASLRQQISVVLQEPLLFSGTVAENIGYGRLDATQDDIVAAAQSANAHDFIARFPRGYDTELGERGAQLSGGERQRICIARAFVKDAPVLILDEPTSSIDVGTEAVILDALERLMVGRTTFLIAHRLSTVRHADRILVLNRGRIVEFGTQEELLAQHGLFRQMWDASSRSAPRSARKFSSRWSEQTAEEPA